MPDTSSLRPIDIFPSDEFCKGYAAGFFDSEGCVGLYTPKSLGYRPKPVISITNCHWHVLNYLQALVLPLLEIDFHGQKSMQLRISAWEGIKNFVDVFKDICIVKREQLELMDEAVKLHENLVKKRKGRKVYSKASIKSFKQISHKMEEAKRRILEHARYMEKWRKAKDNNRKNVYSKG